MKTPRYTLFQQVLDWCNQMRSDRGLPALEVLPKGKPVDGYTCPCGAATGVFVGADGWAETQDDYEDGQEQSIPEAVTEFVERFDSLEFPELEIGK